MMLTSAANFSNKLLQLTTSFNFCQKLLVLTCGGPAASLQYKVSLVQRVNRLFPNWGGSGSRPDDAPTLTMESSTPVGDVLLHW